MWITPLSPPLNASGKGSHGSILSGNYATSRLSSGWKSTPYLPKLRDSSVLENAIGQGISSGDPQFGYAESFDEASGVYRGLVFRALAPAKMPDESLIVRRSVAEIVKEKAAPNFVPTPQPAGSDSVAGSGSSTDLGAPSTGSSKPKRPTRFFGTVEIDAARPIKAVESIVNAVVLELQRTTGAKVKISLDIEAEAPNGFDEGEVNIVRDNARQLKFKPESTGFED